MAEEFPDHSQYYLYQSNASAQPLRPHPQQNQQLRNNGAFLASQQAIRATIIDDRTIQQQRRLEHESYVQKALPNAMRSYGSIYSAHSTIQSESEPLLSKPNIYQYPCGVYGEPIELTRYRRNQIFLAFFIIFYVGYLIVGSICFQRLESEKEQEIRTTFRLARQIFLADNPSVKGSLADICSFFRLIFVSRSLSFNYCHCCGILIAIWDVLSTLCICAIY